MRFTKLHTLVAVAGIALAGGLAYWVQNRPAGTAPGAAGTAAAAGGAGAGQAGRNAAPAGPAIVEVGRVQATTLQDDEVAVGSLRARQGVMLRPEVAGRVARLGFTDGQRVRRGQVLVALDDTLQAAQLKQADAQAQIARTNLQRNRELLADNFISQSAVDQSAAALDVAEAQVALAQAQLGRMKILAPFDGVAGIRLVSVGDYVKDGADLVGVEDTSSVWVDFRLPERVMSRLRQGQPVDVSFDALPERRFKGRVEAIDAQLDANGRSLLVRARVDNPGGLLRTGMFARVRTVFAVREGALVVPEEALVPQGDKRYLFKVVDGPDGAKVAQRLEARVGLRIPGKAEILSGLAAGDRVVTAGHAALLRRDGQALKIVEVGGSDAPSAGRPDGVVFALPGAGTAASPRPGAAVLPPGAAAVPAAVAGSAAL
jgi:membrane fusion protein, multidrug efflux system